jgi:predicted XRE-type DNA-binding protein
MNLQQSIKDILDTGIGQVELASILDCSQSNISFLLNGGTKTTKLELGLRILELHKKVTKLKKVKA